MLPAHIVCCDLAEGMLRTVEEEAQRRSQRVALRIGDIEALPVVSATVDLAIAGYVLYHLDDILRGACESARVIRDDGWALVTTNSDAIHPLVIDMHYRALTALGIPFVPEAPSRFSMENGRAYLESAFKSVEMHYLEDSITYPDSQSFVIGYSTIGRYRALMEDQAVPLEKRQRLATEVEGQASRRIEAARILKAEGLLGGFVCRGPIR